VAATISQAYPEVGAGAGVFALEGG
jgi:hypothetical protein